MQARMAAIMSDRICAHSTAVREPTEWIAKPDMFGRRLQRFTDRVVIRDRQRWRLIAIDQKQRDSARLRDRGLKLRPASWCAVGLFLKNRLRPGCVFVGLHTFRPSD